MIGFTGTREGMTERQRRTCKKTLEYMCEYLGTYSRPVIHGGAIGADTQFHVIADDLGINIFVFPAHKDSFDYWSDKVAFINLFDPKPPLERNKEIVKRSTILIAAPYSLKEENRSGTWATIRYARKWENGIPIIILDP